jgi:hypothetical protein
LDLIDIAFVVLSVWVLFVTCVLALLKAADVGDEALPDERSRAPMPGRPGWKLAMPATTRRPGRHRETSSSQLKLHNARRRMCGQ